MTINEVTPASKAEYDESQKSLLPTTDLPYLDARHSTCEDSLANDITDGLKMAGGCVVRGLVSGQKIDQINTELAPHLKQYGKINIMAKETSVITGLVGKSETFARDVVGNAVYQSVIRNILTSKCGPYWVGRNTVTGTSCPQLDSSLSLRIGPGAKAQGLHKDDMAHHNWLPAAEEYVMGRDVGCILFLALTPTTKPNGATRIVPGSHLWDYATPPPEDESDVVDVELEPGDGLFILGSVYHGGGSNTTTDQYRHVAFAAATRSWLRQDENQYLSHQPENIKRLPLEIQRFVGYSCGDPYTGWVDYSDPLRVFNPDAGDFHDIYR